MELLLVVYVTAKLTIDDRCPLTLSQAFERGVAVGEFVGFVTSGVKGRDVMMGGTKNRGHQIFQGDMGQSRLLGCGI